MALVNSQRNLRLIRPNHCPQPCTQTAPVHWRKEIQRDPWEGGQIPWSFEQPTLKAGH